MIAQILRKADRATAPSRARAPDGRRIYAIGDIHGRADLLDRLLDRIDADASDLTEAGERLDEQVVEDQDAQRATDKPILVLLGDYIDRGANARAVIDRLLSLSAAHYELVFLRGNHEAALLAFLEDPQTGPFWMQIGGGETLASYGVAPVSRTDSAAALRAGADALRARIPASHLAFLNSLLLCARLGDYLFVHAGLRPGRDLAGQSQEDMLTIREPFLAGRARWPFVVVHGHSPVERGFADGRRIGVDTGAYATGRLSAVRLEGESVAFLST